MAEEKKRERIFLTKGEAKELLDWKPDGTVHTFLQNHQILIGADWSRDAVELEMSVCVSLELSGAASRSLRHGIAMVRKEPQPSPVFLATDEDKIRAFEVEIGERKMEEING